MPPADSEITQNKFIKLLSSTGQLSEAEIAQIEKAYVFGARLHKGQKRVSGQDYFKGHCTHVAYHLHRLEMPAPMVIAGLLHDTLENTELTPNMLEEQFGKEITFMVQGVSHLAPLKYRQYKRHVASLRKFFVAVAKDARVIVIKLCDRYHNLQTIEYLPPAKQKRIAEESMLVHAPLAQRLNITQLYQQINDASFPYVFPEEYQRVKALQKIKLSKADKIIRHIYRQCKIILSQNLGYIPTIDRRIKSTYSLYKKLLNKDWNIDAIYDIIALRVIVETVSDCYQVLGLVHARWQPLQNRFKDYIASPKTNGYQSLHTTVFSGDGQVVEIQIKTSEMYREAEFGLASHLSYKGSQSNKKSTLGSSRGKFNWLDQLDILKTRGEMNTRDYLKELRTDFFVDRVFVMTPKGDVIDLKKGATVLDFAFAIHTDLGLRARGGLVNGIYKALKTPLQQQDIVEIVTDKKIRPQKNWLNWTKTPNAHQHLRVYLNKQRAQK